MLVFSFVALGAALLFSLSCGHYQGAGPYRSGGGYKTPSDYSHFPKSTDSNPNYLPSGEFTLYWPVTKAKVNRGYRPASDPDHQGIDLGGQQGTPVLAAHEGRVIYVGRDFRGYGKMVLIEYDKSWATLYAHLHSINVREGQILRPGDPIGGMGRTGRATGVHLHFELMRNRLPIDPLPVLTRSSQFAGRSGR